MLITLGIIGVIAAMTLPALKNNIDDTVRKTQFKKVYNTISQALEATMFEFANDSECYVIGDPIIDGVGNGNGELIHDPIPKLNGCGAFWPQFFDKIKVSSKCVSNCTQNNVIPDYNAVFSDSNCSFYQSFKTSSTVYTTPDGALLIPGKNEQAYFMIIDINGKKGPNKVGYDLFDTRIYYHPQKKHAYFELVSGSCRLTIAPGGKSFHNMIIESNK